MAEKRHRELKIAGIVLAVIIVLAIIGSFLPEEGEKPVAQEPAPAETTPVETEPVETEPVETEPGFTDAEQAYAEEVAEDAQAVSEAIQSVGRDIQDWPFSDEEVLTIAGNMATVRTISDKYKNMDPPSERFAPVHRKLQNSLAAYTKAMRRLAYGVDHLDAEAIEEAAALMTDGTRLVAKAGKMMNDLTAEIGL